MLPGNVSIDRKGPKRNHHPVYVNPFSHVEPDRTESKKPGVVALIAGWYLCHRIAAPGLMEISGGGYAR